MEFSTYAEADPTFDINGLDARDKLCILARMAFGGRSKVSMIPTYGIRQVRAIDVHSANRLDSTIRLIGSAENTQKVLKYRCGHGWSAAARCWRKWRA
jgi:homoserine dehydrogenase